MATHAPLAPSAAGRWGAQCPGSTALEAAAPEVPKSQDAIEGDAAHWVGATRLRALAQFGRSPIITPGMADPAGTIITEEMVDAADLYVDTVVERVGSDALDKLHVEEKVTAYNLVHPANEGTPDAYCIAGGNGTPGAFIDLFDFKYGHRFVDAFENWQCINYTAGILELPQLAGMDWNNIRVRISIVQPRCYGHGEQVRTWERTAEELRPYINQLRERAFQSMGPGAPCIVGPACRDCDGAIGGRCVALLRAGEGVMDAAGFAVPMQLPPEALAVYLRYIERAETLLKALKTGMQTEAESYIRQGVAVPGWTLQQGEGRLAWVKPVGEVFALGDTMGVDLRKEQPAITPTQATKAFAAILDKETAASLVAGYAARPKGETKLIPVNLEKARRIFGQ